MSEIVFHYFDLYARGELSRMILHYSNTSYIEQSYSRETWPEYKKLGIFEFEQLPMLEIDGLKLVQSLSIERYLCQKFGYYPSDPYEIYLTESLKMFDKILLKKKQRDCGLKRMKRIEIIDVEMICRYY